MMCDHTKSGLAHRPTAGCVAQQSVYPSRQRCCVLHHREATGVSQHRDMVSEIAGVWPDGDCTTEARWLERILSAAGRQQAAADKGEPA